MIWVKLDKSAPPVCHHGAYSRPPKGIFCPLTNFLRRKRTNIPYHAFYFYLEIFFSLSSFREDQFSFLFFGMVFDIFTDPGLSSIVCCCGFTFNSVIANLSASHKEFLLVSSVPLSLCFVCFLCCCCVKLVTTFCNYFVCSLKKKTYR